jgi:hypothetical protein
MADQFVEIEFCDPLGIAQPLRLCWRVSNSKPAEIWFQLLKQNIEKKLDLETRFSGFVNSRNNLKSIAEKLNECIRIINEDGRYSIPERASESFSQELANKLHHDFEILSGPSWNPSEYALKSPPQVLRALQGLNEFVHDIESLKIQTDQLAATGEYFACAFGVFSQKRNGTKVACEKVEIGEDDEKHFTLDHKFGDMVLHYAQIGKVWLSKYLENDNEVSDDAILPHRYITGNIDILFGRPMGEKDKWNFAQFLESRGRNFNDPSLRLGYLPVANLNSGLDHREIQNKLGVNDSIGSITLRAPKFELKWHEV